MPRDGDAVLDIAVVNTALSFLARDLHSGLSGVQWVVDAYTAADDGHHQSAAARPLTSGQVPDTW